MTHSTAVTTIRALAAYGLPGSEHQLPGRPLDEHVWHELLFRARAQRMAPLLATAVADGALPATRTQSVQAMDLHIRALRDDLRIEATLVRVGGILSAAGIDFRVLKGVAAAHLDYPDSAHRHFGDVDLLIHPNDLDRAIAIVGRHGFVRRFPEPRRGFDRRFTKGVCVADRHGHEVDIHRTLAPGPFGVEVDVDRLWSTPPTPFSLGGVTFAALSPELRILHACYHASLGDAPPRLVPQRDIAELVLRGHANARTVIDVAHTWRGAAVVAHAVASTWQTLRLADAVALSSWAARYVPSERDRMRLARATSPGYTYAVQTMDSIRAIAGVRNRVAYLSALAFPQRGYLRDRRSGAQRRRLRALSEVLKARTPDPSPTNGASGPHTHPSTTTGGDP